jgi:NitT/TauT family transport system substrate-binding protein
MDKFRVTNQCIGCKACVRIADNTFKMEDYKAVVQQQPTNDLEQQQAIEAMKTCPTQAIQKVDAKVIIGNTNVRQTIEKHPFLEDELIELSDKFKTLQKPIMWNTVAKFATFNDAAKMTGVSLCELLHFVNAKLGLEEELEKIFPNCIHEVTEEKNEAEEVYWSEGSVYTIEDEEDLEKMIEKIDQLAVEESLVIESTIDLSPVLRYLEEKTLTYQTTENDNHHRRLSIYNDHDDDIKQLDVRHMSEDPFDVIIKQAYGTKAGQSFRLIQTFIPTPLINMLQSMGFDHTIEKETSDEVWIQFTKMTEESSSTTIAGEKPSLTIQSATPVGYPIIMRLLQSEKLRDVINIKQLKVWEETEKHLGWIVNGKADISFSSVITASKFKNAAVKMPAIFVWDNFVLLSRNKDVKHLADLKGKEIDLPLFEEAPPAKITQYLIEAKGLKVDDFTFKFGNPFGRPKEIMTDFIMGRAENVLLREPEASFAVEAVKQQDILFSEISYKDLWKAINPDVEKFPNAGVIVKEELYDKYPEVMAVFMEELKASIDWVNQHPHEAAKLSFDMMRNSIANVEAFINRVDFTLVTGEPLVDQARQFYTILSENNVVDIPVDDDLLNLFKV